MKSVSHTRSIEIDYPIEKAFPLFSPEGEKRWVPDWDYLNIMGTTQLDEDYVFVTDNHDHASSQAIWVVKQYAPEKHVIQLYKIEPTEKVGTITVSCSRLTDNRTRVEVTYKYVALSSSGEEFIAIFTPDTYREFIAEWQSLLEDYIRSNSQN